MSVYSRRRRRQVLREGKRERDTHTTKYVEGVKRKHLNLLLSHDLEGETFNRIHHNFPLASNQVVAREREREKCRRGRNSKRVNEGNHSKRSSRQEERRSEEEG